MELENQGVYEILYKNCNKVQGKRANVRRNEHEHLVKKMVPNKTCQ